MIVKNRQVFIGRSFIDTDTRFDKHIIELGNAFFWGIPLEGAVFAASTAPANAVGPHDVGSIKIGKNADLVVLGKDLSIKAVFINGVRQLL